MKELLDRTRAFLKGTRGETLIEGIASILVFSVLMASITMTILLSLRITGVTTASANQRQAEANAVLSSTSPAISESGNISLILELESGTTQTITIGVTVYSTDDFTAFEPTGGGSP
jgi:hypothetical protein